MRPHAILTLWRDCPSEDVYIQFGDLSLYKYPAGVAAAQSVRSGLTHGRVFNLPAIRRSLRRPGPGYERVESIPSGAIVLFEDPPYVNPGDMPACDTPPTVLYWPDAMQTWADAEHDANNGGPCALVECTQDDVDNYTGGTCIGPVFVTNFGAFWNLSMNVGTSVVFRTGGTNVIGPWNYFSGFVQVTPPSDWLFETS